jgi:hypothetical protein
MPFVWSAPSHIFEFPRNSSNALGSALRRKGQQSSALPRPSRLASSKSMPSSRPGRALMRSIVAAARGGLGCGQGGKVQHRCFQAGSALARSCVCLGVGSKGAVHRCRARPRCRSVHAAPVCGVGGKGTATHIGADEGGAAGEESERCKPRQPDKSLYCGLNGTHCPCASSG